MIEYLADHDWAFNAGNYLDETDKFVTNIRLLEGLQLAYSVEKLVCKMSDFVARVSMRGLRSG